MTDRSGDSAAIPDPDARRAFVDANLGGAVADVVALCRFRSISGDANFAAASAEAAAWLVKRLRAAGARDVISIETPGNPVVIASGWPAAPEVPTVLIYGHYDVQPPGHDRAWTGGAFEPSVDGSGIHARGASDMKGGLVASILALEALLAQDAHLPVRVVFLLDGDEEVGSPHLEAVVQAHRQRLAADVVLTADSPMASGEQPAVLISTRGSLQLEIEVAGPKRPLHPGLFGGLVRNPAEVLAVILGGIHDAEGRVVIPGFHDGVPAVTQRVSAEISRIPFDASARARELGVPELWGEPGFSPDERRWVRPVLEVAMMMAGDAGPPVLNAIPSRAVGFVNVRTVDGQDPDYVAECVARYLGRPFPGVDVKVTHGRGPTAAWSVASDDPLVMLARESLSEGFNGPAALLRSGGTTPIPRLAQMLDARCLFVGFQAPDENQHAPDEWFRVASLRAGAVAYASLLARLPTTLTTSLDEAPDPVVPR